MDAQQTEGAFPNFAFSEPPSAEGGVTFGDGGSVNKQTKRDVEDAVPYKPPLKQWEAILRLLSRKGAVSIAD